MHAFLLIGTNKESLNKEIEKLAKIRNARVMEYSIVKIEDVRNLNNLLRLSLDRPTLIVGRDIHESGDEALNAFLKNLEEPQNNAYFALTAPSLKKVLPTIVSRCEIIKIQSGESEISEETTKEMENFFSLSKSEMLSFVDKIKDRVSAIEFAENMVFFMHGTLHQNELKYDFSVEDIRLATKTLSGLKANGNVNLQLSNFVVNYK